MTWHISEKYEFVNWDDDIPNFFGKIKNVPVTTNQIHNDLLSDSQMHGRNERYKARSDALWNWDPLGIVDPLDEVQELVYSELT